MAAEGGIQSEEIVKRCSFAGCDRPDESSHFYTVTEGTKLGGRDWSSLFGLTLCNACYTRYLCKGTLEKSMPILRRCSYEGCPNPTESKSFTLVEAGCKTGNRDWTPLVGRVLCKSCMVRYGKRGTLERTRNQRNKPLAQELRRCTYSGCVKPEESSKYVLIEEGRTSGRQDWSPIVGNVLCTACYMRYKQRGTLKRCYNKDIPSAVRRCSYAGCDAPEEGSNFYQVLPLPACLRLPPFLHAFILTLSLSLSHSLTHSHSHSHTHTHTKVMALCFCTGERHFPRHLFATHPEP